MLEDNWKTIRDEGLANMDAKRGAFLPEEENLRETGDWKQFTLFQQGQSVSLVSSVDSIRRVMTNCDGICEVI